MKKIGILLIAIFIHFCSFGQRISFEGRSMTLRSVLDSIEHQTGIYYYTNDVDLDQTVGNVRFQSKDMKTVLQLCLQNLHLEYELTDNVIKIYRPSGKLVKTGRNIHGTNIFINVIGTVSDENNHPISGVSVKSNVNMRIAVTNNAGIFVLRSIPNGSSISVSHMGYYGAEFKAGKDSVKIQLSPYVHSLKELIVSTGYQQTRKDHTTGSYVLIDNSTISRSVSPDILSRLKGVTNGMLFDPQTGNTTGISIRGRSTIYSETRPLFILDNFPFEGDISTINPNDIEDITILKDAAAAAIWGVRAGNGVIVMNTKKGKNNQRTIITLNANMTSGAIPDLHYQPQLSSSEFVDVERFLYERGNYFPALSNSYQLISPVIALLHAKTPDNAAATEAAIDSYRGSDVRNQLRKYFYKPSVRMQYYLSFTGGGPSHSYHISGGYDYESPVSVGTTNKRYTLKLTNNFDLLNHRVRILTNLTLSRQVKRNDFYEGYTPLYPYERLADPSGNALPTLSASGLRSSYTDTAGHGKLLNWQYKPLEELRQKSNNYLAESNEIRINTGLTYQIIPSLRLGIDYQYCRSLSLQEHISDMNSYTVRNAINEVTQINRTTNEIIRPLPPGAFIGKGNMMFNTSYGRAQVEYNGRWNPRHILTAIAGYEIRAERHLQDTEHRYGYDLINKTSNTIDQITLFPFFYKPESRRLGIDPTPTLQTINHYISYYSNVTYIYNGKWVVSGSYRKDASNLFGVAANQKGVPLYAAGLSWKLSGERFCNIKFLNLLQLRATYGYNGNVNKSLSAFTTTKINKSRNYWDTPFSIIDNPPNSSLRWERIKNINFGIDFALKKEILTGSIEYYIKSGVDLIGTTPVASQTGVRNFTGNIANTRTKGLDILLNIRIINSPLQWNATLIYNLSKDRVTRYAANRGANKFITGSVTLVPLEGYPINSLFSFRYGGLDEAGDPRGYIGGQLTKNYTSIVNATDLQELKFEGSAAPVSFGSVRNTFKYKEVELSLNVSYKLGYYFRSGVLNYSALVEGDYKGYGYSNRWIKPGDEYKTTVPAMIYPANPLRDQFYNLSEATAERGDHIRLNDIQCNFTFPNNRQRLSALRGLSVYAFANNLGILWRANRQKLDPDVRTEYPAPRSFSIGIKKNFN